MRVRALCSAFSKKPWELCAKFTASLLYIDGLRHPIKTAQSLVRVGKNHDLPQGTRPLLSQLRLSNLQIRYPIAQLHQISYTAGFQLSSTGVGVNPCGLGVAPHLVLVGDAKVSAVIGT